MTDKELRGLSRQELLEMLIEQNRQANALRAQLERTKAALEERRICIERSGSIAEAALALNHLFDNAQKAANQYLENVRIQEAEADRIVARANEQADAILKDANEQANRLMQQAQAEHDQLIAETSRESQRRLSEFNSKMQEFLHAQNER